MGGSVGVGGRVDGDERRVVSLPIIGVTHQDVTVRDGLNELRGVLRQRAGRNVIDQIGAEGLGVYGID